MDGEDEVDKVDREDGEDREDEVDGDEERIEAGVVAGAVSKLEIALTSNYWESVNAMI